MPPPTVTPPEAEGNVDHALRYYEAAGQSDTATGRAARSRYVSLDLPRRPGEYVKTRVSMLEGRPVLEVAKAADIELVEITVGIALLWADGRAENLTRRIARLGAGEQVIVALPARGALSRAQASATAARLAR